LNKIVIADAGPLIAFARLHQLGLLPQIFERVLVTDIVFAECAGRSYFPESVLIQEAVTRKQLELCASPDFSAFAQKIDAGEASAIAVAIECGCGVLMDDKAGRRMATNASVPVIGTVGVLVLAKRKGLIPLVMPLLKNLATSGYFLSEEIIAAALTASGE
jgi:predicted nucleic acid-binding protein